MSRFATRRVSFYLRRLSVLKAKCRHITRDERANEQNERVVFCWYGNGKYMFVRGDDGATTIEQPLRI